MTTEDVCKGCGGTDFVLDEAHGDFICSSCGDIFNEREISTEAEYRIYNDDSESQNKVRVGEKYNILEEYSLTERSRLERDDKEFLWDGQKNIDDILFRIFRGTKNATVEHRAKEIFAECFRLQTDQKKGLKYMKQSDDKKRQRFSKRKQFVVTSVWTALAESKIPHIWDIAQISKSIDGALEVSENSVETCLRELKYDEKFGSNAIYQILKYDGNPKEYGAGLKLRLLKDFENLKHSMNDKNQYFNHDKVTFETHLKNFKDFFEKHNCDKDAIKKLDEFWSEKTKAIEKLLESLSGMEIKQLPNKQKKSESEIAKDTLIKKNFDAFLKDLKVVVTKFQVEPSSSHPAKKQKIVSGAATTTTSEKNEKTSEKNEKTTPEKIEKNLEKEKKPSTEKVTS